ncbi:MAG: MgtC/SapB family protein [Firmicutes bacterium]|nr:MgtC/SapB family protein [Bacillota bacterium]
MVDLPQIILRLVLSIFLSGIIGIERESIKRPAGFRTHILVCVGSTLVMLVGTHIFELYKYDTNLDPARLSAQVISGIGFLGAGTIIKEGDTVKGLTTAASLWAVACVGLAVGAGFYFGAITTTFLIFITLMVFTKIERNIKSRRNYIKLKVITINKPGQLGKLGIITGSMGATIESIELQTNDKKSEAAIDLLIRLKDKKDGIKLVKEISTIEGVKELSQR